MARPTGSKNKITLAVKDAVEHAFNTVNRDGQYLINVANDDPKTFLAIVAKCIPTAVAVDIKHTIDLAGAMLASQEQLQTLQANNEIKTIEHVERVTLSPNSETPNKEITAKSLETKDK